MRFYLDDDTAYPLLARLLRQAGHDVELPADAGIAGSDDPVHLTHAIDTDRSCISQNYRDFENLHNLVMRSGGHHPGIFIVGGTTTRGATSCRRGSCG
jgi:D-serine dehydratase